MTQAACSKHHICHLVYSFSIGGLEKLIAECVTELSIESRHTIICLSHSSKDMTEQLPEGVEVITLNKAAGQDLSMHWKLYSLFRKLRPTVVHSYNIATLEYQWVAFFARVPIRIHAEHGRSCDDPEGKNKKHQFLRRVCSPVIDSYITVSSDLYHWMRNVVGIKKEKVRCIINGVNTNKFKPSKDSEEKKRFVIGHVGRLQPVKQQSVLIDAYGIACQNNPIFAQFSQLVLVGEGSEMTLLQKQVNSLGLNVIFEGAQKNVLPFYQEFDVFCLTSKAEGIPVSLLEAMSMGIPSVVSNVGGIPEVVSHNTNGILAESDSPQQFASAFEVLYQNKQFAEKLAIKGRSTVVEKFSFNTMLNEYRQHYGL